MTGRLRNVVLALLVVIGGLALALEYSARSAATRIAAAFEPLATLRYESAGATWNGDVRLTAPRLEVHSGRWNGSAQARSATIRGDRWLWTLVSGLVGGGVPSEARIEVHGLELLPAAGSGTFAAWLRAPGQALFEKQGCPGEALGVVERERMGVPAAERFDRFDYRFDATSGRLELDVALEQPGIAAIDGSLELGSFMPARADFSADVRLVQAEFAYRDPGYLAVRNTLCAQRLGIGTEAFIERHLAAVDELLGGYGVTFGDSVRGLYRLLVSEGGTLKVTVLPDPTWLPIEALDMPRGELLRVLNATARHANAPPIMVQLAFADAREPWFAEAATGEHIGEAGVASADAVPDAPAQAEDAAAIVPPAVSAAAPSTPTVAPGPNLPNAPLIGSQSPEPAPVTRTAEPPPQSIPTRPVASAPPIPAPAPASTPASVPAPITRPAEPPPTRSAAPARPSDASVAVDSGGPVQEFGASAPPPPANSTLALVWKPGVIERLGAREAPTRDYHVISASEIGAHRGRRVRLLTVGGKLVDGELRGVDSGQALMRVRATSGTAEVAVPLSNVREIRLVASAER